jgi:hypothetical protein
MQRRGVDRVTLPDLHQLAGIHDGQVRAQVTRRSKVVGDHHIGEPQALLQALQEVEDLCPDGDVQGGDRFVEDNQPRIGHQRPGNGNTLALPAAELVRVEQGAVAAQSHQG